MRNQHVRGSVPKRAGGRRRSRSFGRRGAFDRGDHLLAPIGVLPPDYRALARRRWPRRALGGVETGLGLAAGGGHHRSENPHCLAQSPGRHRRRTAGEIAQRPVVAGLGAGVDEQAVDRGRAPQFRSYSQPAWHRVWLPQLRASTAEQSWQIKAIITIAGPSSASARTTRRHMRESGGARRSRSRRHDPAAPQTRRV